MKHLLFISLLLLAPRFLFGQVDENDSANVSLNQDAVYDRPFLELGKFPVALGGYAEVKMEYFSTDRELSFQMQRLTLFFSSTIHRRIRFLTEIEFEEGTKEINIEYAALDFEFNPLLNFRGGIILNPIGGFNQNHDGPKWDFVDRPLVSTQLLPATWSNAGLGFYGKAVSGQMVFGYEAYLSNGFDPTIIDNAEGKTFLPASKENPDRFEESFNGMPMGTSRVSAKHRRLGEIGLSWMGGIYNGFKDDQLVVDEKRWQNALALDVSSTLPVQTVITGEVVWNAVEVPQSYSQQYGSRQWGFFADVVHPVIKRKMAGFETAAISLGLRFDYVDWNLDEFRETGEPISDAVFGLTGAIAFRPTGQTVARLNYLYRWQHDLFGNPPEKTAAIQFGLSSYF
jgi:hypothetical protein